MLGRKYAKDLKILQTRTHKKNLLHYKQTDGFSRTEPKQTKKYTLKYKLQSELKLILRQNTQDIPQ